jgi:hypothetical protein
MATMGRGRTTVLSVSASPHGRRRRAGSHINATRLLDGSLHPLPAVAMVLANALVKPESGGTLKLASPDPGDAPLANKQSEAEIRWQTKHLNLVALHRTGGGAHDDCQFGA